MCRSYTLAMKLNARFGPARVGFIGQAMAGAIFFGIAETDCFGGYVVGLYTTVCS